MKTYSITYDLGNPGRNYEGVIAKIKELANGYCNATESHWFINSNSKAAVIRDAIAGQMDAGDKLMVNEVGDGWGTWGLPNNVNEWLHNNWYSACRVD